MARRYMYLVSMKLDTGDWAPLAVHGSSVAARAHAALRTNDTAWWAVTELPAGTKLWALHLDETTVVATVEQLPYNPAVTA